MTKTDLVIPQKESIGVLFIQIIADINKQCFLTLLDLNQFLDGGRYRFVIFFESMQLL